MERGHDQEKRGTGAGSGCAAGRERIGLRLALDEVVGSVGPHLDLAHLVVEHQVAAIGAHHQHRMAIAIGFAHHRHQQCRDIPAAGRQLTALGQRDRARADYDKALALTTIGSPMRRVLELKLSEVGGVPAQAKAGS